MSWVRHCSKEKDRLESSAAKWLVALALLSCWQPAIASDLHPDFPLLDASGAKVVESGEPLSTRKTCGACHDTDFIASHSYHSTGALDAFTRSSGGEIEGPDYWDSISYRSLTPPGEPSFDMGVADWLINFGGRYVGGANAEIDPEGHSLGQASSDRSSSWSRVLDPETGQSRPWDWQESGTVEMDCFLCHLESPSFAAREFELREGRFRWANTATLEGLGLVAREENGWRWQSQHFDGQGRPADGLLEIRHPSNENCGQCHGQVHSDLSEPLVLWGLDGSSWETDRTGQILSPQFLSASGLNLEGKAALDRSWDVHLERVVQCVNCHYSLNNPIYFQRDPSSELSHLVFDARRRGFSEYLVRPLHEFAKGSRARSTAGRELASSMRRCEDCHDSSAVHDWLPYRSLHLQTLSCESCHIPRQYAPALRTVDWTMLDAAGEPLRELRGVDGDLGPETLIRGFRPVLLPRNEALGEVALAPFNPITSWYWVQGESRLPVRAHDLRRALFEGDGYKSEILAAFDDDGDGLLTNKELRLTAETKVEVMRQRLVDLGLEDPEIRGEVEMHGIHHGVAKGEWALRECSSCHGESSRIREEIELAGYHPGGVVPLMRGGSSSAPNGEIGVGESGEIRYLPDPRPGELYVLGLDRVRWVDQLGWLLMLMTLMGTAAHGGLRAVSALRQPRREIKTERVYMYGLYERLWHWLQTVAIIGLIVTGLFVHRPDFFHMVHFRASVLVHNALGFVLLGNALLAVFFHLASGEIRQYLPQPRGMFSQMIVQGTYYVKGIFRGDPHPFEKNPQRKLNPLQQVTYFGILNVLLPLQVLTGLLMWGVQRWPVAAGAVGGLPFLAPFHSLIAWVFSSFIVTHVYLTTTGHSPLAGIEAMIDGWDEVEVSDESDS